MRRTPTPAITVSGIVAALAAQAHFNTEFNSGDRGRYQTFLERKFPSALPHLDQHLEIRALTGGLDLRKLNSVSATQVAGWVQERKSSASPSHPWSSRRCPGLWAGARA